MDVIWVAASGVAIVLILILLLRLHPLLSLLIGALFVFAATPRNVLLTSELADREVEVVSFGGGGLVGTNAVTAEPGQYYLSRELTTTETPQPLQLVAVDGQVLQAAAVRGELSSAAKSWLSLGPKAPALKKGDKIVLVDAVRAVDAERWSSLGGKLAAGFGKTFIKLGVPVTMAAIVGVCLLESGAAAKLVAAIMSLFGPRGTAPALTLSGFILGVPVFFDNVFYLLLPLAKAVGRQRAEGYLAAVMAIIVGATMAHSLVPPTPGPLLVAAALQVNVGTMMIGGTIVGGLAACVGFAYGMFCSRWIRLSPEGLSIAHGESCAGTEVRRPSRALPLWVAALPIAVPILILGGAEIIQYFSAQHPASIMLQNLQRWVAIINDPGLIFIGTAILSILMLRYTSDGKVVGQSVTRGIADAGTIVLLTCAGGAFGAALQQLDLATAIGERFEGLTTPWGILWTAFILTTIIRVAQGSATVAMITSVAIVGPVMESIELPFHPVYVALAIGCGSKPLPWMNDSGFWQVATMSGMSTTQTLKSFSAALTLMGIVGFGCTLVGAWMLPLV